MKKTNQKFLNSELSANKFLEKEQLTLSKVSFSAGKQDGRDSQLYVKNEGAVLQTPAKKRFFVRVSVLYIMMMAVMIALGQGYQVVVYTAAMTLHELAHAEVATRLGYGLVSFRLMPYGASLTGNFEGARYKDELKIAAAGPFFSLVLAIPAVAMWWLFPPSYYITREFVSASIFIAAFNLLPVFPLDGGRMLLAGLSLVRPRQKVYRFIRVFGFCFAAVFALLFVLTLLFKVNFSFAFVAIFMLISSIIPDKSSYYQRLYSLAYRSERLKKGLRISEVMVSEQATVLELGRMLSGNCYTNFLVVGTDLKVKFRLTETEFESLCLAPNQKISDAEIMQKKQK